MRRGKELTRAALRSFPLPAQGDGDKDAHGRLLVVAGSRETPGSALLCALAAFRSGAGRVRIATVESAARGDRGIREETRRKRRLARAALDAEG